MPPLLADFSHARACKPFCEKYLTLPNATSLLLNLLPKGECHMKRHIEYHICYILYKKQKTRHIHTCRIFLHWWRRMDSNHRS